MKKITLFILLGFLMLAWPTYATEITEINIKVALETNLPPFQFLDESGRVAGLHVDLMNEIAAHQEFSIEYIPFNSTSQAVEALNNGEVDLILGVSAGEQLPDHLTLTNELTSASISLVVENSHLDQVLHPDQTTERYTTGFELGTMTLSQISQLNTMYASIMGNQTQLFDSFVSGEIDSIATVKESFLYQLSHRSNLPSSTYTIVNNYLGTVKYAIALPRSDRILTTSINNALNQMRYRGVYDRLVEDWLPDTELIAAEGLIDRLFKAVFIVVSVAAIALFFIYLWNRKLKVIVEEKTQEIKEQMKNLERESILRNLLIEQSPNSIMLVNTDGGILHMNPRSKQVSELASTDSPDEYHRVEQLGVFRDIWEETNHMSQAPGMESSALTTIRAKNGQKRLFRYQYYVLNNNYDKVLLVEDVTEEEQERTEAFETNKNQTLNRIIAGVAHEIKNPLTAIKAFASLIKEQADEKEFQESFAKYVPAEVDRINRLIESLIHYARPVRGLQERIDLVNLVEECIHLTHPSADSRIIFQNNFKQPYWIRANRDQLKQVIINLLINAIESVNEKLSREPSEHLLIETMIYRTEAHVVLSIRDQGTGMSEIALEQCTDPFFTTKARGTGMGLSLAKQFVHENNGDFSIESVERKYTLVTITFLEDPS